jgi:hypothetical protein
MTLKDRIENNAALLFCGALITGFVSGVGAFRWWIDNAGRTVIEVREKKALEDEIAKLKSGLVSAQQSETTALADSKRLAVEIATLRETNSRILSSTKLRNESTKPLQTESLAKDPNAIRQPSPPSKWQEFKGFNNLTGLWRGESGDGVKFEVEILPQDGDQVSAVFSAERMNCRLVARLAKATDDQLTTSNYFFKPATVTAGCPDVESVMLRPFETISDFRMTYTNGKIWGVRLHKKI